MSGADKTFIKDNVRQLKAGMSCYVYINNSKFMLDKIIETYKEATGLDLDVSYNNDGYALIKPKKRLTYFKY